MKKRMKQVLTEERGATSVLVIFMMIVLVTLGAFAITSARANFNLSNAALDWNKMFYALDTRGEEYLRDVDGALAQAEKKAIDYGIKKGFENINYEGIPADIQNEAHDNWLLSVDKKAAAEHALEKVYEYYAKELLTDLSNSYPDSMVTVTHDALGGSFLSSEINFTSDKDDKAHVRVALKATPITDNYTLRYEDGKFSGDRNPEAKRYAVKDWSQWQEELEPTNPAHEGLWDGSIGDMPPNPDAQGGTDIFSKPPAGNE